MTELKPCPFCGNKVEFSQYEYGNIEDGYYDYAYISCVSCEIQTPSFDISINDVEELIEKWNTRHESEKYKKLLALVQRMEIFNLGYQEKITDAKCENDLIDVFKCILFDVRSLLLEIKEIDFCRNEVERLKKLLGK